MSKTRQKNKSEVEQLRGENRKLRSQNRQLRKRVNQLERKAHFYEEVVEEITEDVTIKKSCPECDEGILQELDMIHVIITKCTECDYRKTRKPRKKS